MDAHFLDHETGRLTALREHHLLDTPPEQEFDDLARLAAHICGVPIAAVSLIDERRQWFKAITGLAITETPREAAFCAHTILQSDLMVIPDAQTDPRFRDNPLVTGDPGIRFYAGAPLITEDGYALGSLCVIDRVPRSLTAEQEAALRLLARQASGHLRAARRLAERERLLSEKEHLAAERERADWERLRLAAIIETCGDAIYSVGLDTKVTSWNGGAERLYGYCAAEIISQGINLLVPPERCEELNGIMASVRRGERIAPLEMVRVTKAGVRVEVSVRVSPLTDGHGCVIGAAVVAHDITERRRIEATLEAEREFTYAMLENLQEGIVACDAQGAITFLNRARREMHDLPAQPLPPEQWAEHFGLYQTDGVTPLRTEDIPLFRALRGEIVREAEIVVVPKSGPARTVLVNGQSIHNARGEKLGAVVAQQDVTERRRTEEALRRSEARMADAQRVAKVGSWDYDLVENKITWSDELFRLFDRDRAKGEPNYEDAVALYHPEDAPKLDLMVARAAREGVSYALDLRGAPSAALGGHSKWYHTVGAAVTDAAGRVVRLTGTLADITDRKRAESAQQESEAALRAVLESAPIILYAADADGTVTLSQGTGLASLGLKPGEAVGRSVFEFSGGDAEIEAHTRRALAGETISYDARVYGLCLHTQMRPVRNAAGVITGIIGVCFDITGRALAEERFRVLFEQSSDAHLLFNEGGIIDCNDASVDLLRCSDKAQLLSLHPAALSPEFQPDGSRSLEKCVEMDALAREHGFHRFEWAHRRMDGEEFPVEVTLTPVTLAGGPVLLAVWHDLTERKRAEEAVRDHAVVLEFQKQELERANEELEALATTDGLTGLKNHRTFQERLAEEVNRAARYGTPLSLVLLDVDRFKQYNDAHGHPAGDAVLRAAARILQDCARDTDLVARYGGEEFVLILPQTDLDGAAVVAERVREAVADHSWPVQAVTASLGVAALRPGEESGAEMIARADAALYQSKAAGRNRVICGGSKNPNSTPGRSLLPGEATGVDRASDAGQPVAVFSSDLNGTFLQVNTRACELLGYTEAELVGASGYDLIHPDDIDGQGWRMDDVAAGQVVVTERRIRRKDGTWLQAELRTQQTARGRAECVVHEVAAGGQAERERQEEAFRRFTFMRDVLAAVTEGRLTLCRSEADLPAPLQEPSEPFLLSTAGGLRELRQAAWGACRKAGLSEDRAYDMMTAVGEAGMNSVVHAGAGTGQISVDPLSGTVQVRITDFGGGIPSERLPSAVLKKGFSAAGTLGQGMKMMLQAADRVFLLTGSGGTAVVIEQGTNDAHDPLPRAPMGWDTKIRTCL